MKTPQIRTWIAGAATAVVASATGAVADPEQRISKISSVVRRPALVLAAALAVAYVLDRVSRR
ncbi:hypothetical protein [Actinoplanes sp. NPDC026619]|uniref:hypothetical protein n=1 Tax=Actinoplanes sp. NPDC026619 TaxID=3155798 RepID=UPI0033D9F4F7